MSCKYFFLDLSFLVGCGRFPPNFCFPKIRKFCLSFTEHLYSRSLTKNRRNRRISLKLTRMKKFDKTGSPYNWKLICLHIKELFNPSQSKRVTAFPPIFVKEPENKCSEREMECSVIGRQNVWQLGEQKFGGNLPQPTRKLRSRTFVLLNAEHFVSHLPNISSPIPNICSPVL